MEIERGLLDGSYGYGTRGGSTITVRKRPKRLISFLVLTYKY